jgi:hypothetical protein
MAGAIGWWKIHTIGRAKIYRSIETWARIRAVGWEAHDRAVDEQRRAEGLAA